MNIQRFFSVMESDREVANVSLVTGAALEWNENRSTRTVYQVVPSGGGDWERVRQVTTEELLAALRG